MKPDFSGYDLEYAELHRCVFERSAAELSLHLMCPRADWYWIEKLNALKRGVGIRNQTVSGVMLSLSFSGVLGVQGNLPDAIESGSRRLPLEFDDVSVGCEDVGSMTLRLVSGSFHVEVSFRSCAVEEIHSVDLLDRLVTRPTSP